MASYLRTHRKRSGLSQQDIATILGTLSRNQVGRHERSLGIPLLLAAIGYEVVFRTSLEDLFPGIYETVRHSVERQLADFEEQLQQSTAKGREASAIARKLEWFNERRTRILRAKPTSDEQQ